MTVEWFALTMFAWIGIPVLFIIIGDLYDIT
jgi:hypothetical protein